MLARQEVIRNQYSRESDTLVVHSMYRLARSMIDLRWVVMEQTARGVTLDFIICASLETTTQRPSCCIPYSAYSRVQACTDPRTSERRDRHCEGRR